MLREHSKVLSTISRNHTMIQASMRKPNMLTMRLRLDSMSSLNKKLMLKPPLKKLEIPMILKVSTQDSEMRDKSMPKSSEDTVSRLPNSIQPSKFQNSQKKRQLVMSQLVMIHKIKLQTE